MDMILSGRNLFLIFILLAGNFLQPLFPCNTTKSLQESMGIRHIIGFFTLLFFMVVSYTELDSYFQFGTLLVTTIAIYLWFLFASKMTANWWILLIVLFGSLYLINLYEDQQDTPTQETVEMLRRLKDGLLVVSLFITAVGFILFVGEKKLEYRGKFNFYDLFLSPKPCKGAETVAPYGKTFQAAFFDPPGARMSGGGMEGEIGGVGGGFFRPQQDGGEDVVPQPQGVQMGGYAGIPMKMPEPTSMIGGDPWAKEAIPVSSTLA